MRQRPIAITVLALYLMVVFSISAIGSIYGALSALPPYSTKVWLVLAIPQLIAMVAGFALWRMLKIGAFLWAASILLGWGLAFLFQTGFFPNFSAALVVSVVIIAASAWALISNWDKLLSLTGAKEFERASNA